ncbi:ABC transporter ATP-binding protein [Nocardioidaceae bacterium SCSIO 66511]|nr:ABC transporter ATP-binding protein [Nocardioidaceae bacterium SCSIO 66511]
MTTPAVSIAGLHKQFGDVTAVDGIDLEIAPGEFFSMLGPSGSGKTTVLRMIAGFEAPTDGTIHLDGQDVTRLAPFERNVTTVFQDYALFPHMSVVDNVAYGLRVRGVARDERRERASAALRTVALQGYEKRRPSQLSGGQRQRVALARALVVDPAVLLLDEPLGALDLKLREQMQVELKQIQRDVGITFVFVTHDQEEALTMSDRVAVFNDGRIQQVGSAHDVYEQPASEFVAGFVGTSNLLEGEAARTIVGRDGKFAVRPEKLEVQPDLSQPVGSGRLSADGVLAENVYAGATTRLVVDLDAGARLTVLTQNRSGAAREVTRGDRVRVAFDEQDCLVLNGEQA